MLSDVLRGRQGSHLIGHWFIAFCINRAISYKIGHMVRLSSHHNLICLWRIVVNSMKMKFLMLIFLLELVHADLKFQVTEMSDLTEINVWAVSLCVVCDVWLCVLVFFSYFMNLSMTCFMFDSKSWVKYKSCL